MPDRDPDTSRRTVGDGARAVPVLVALHGLVSILGCGGGAGSAAVEATRTDSAGIEIVTSPGEDRALTWRLEPLFALGGEDEGPEMFTRVHSATVGADTASRLYVLDPRAFRVVVFDSDGTVLRTMGSEGEGPGEMQIPADIAVASDGTVRAFDFGKGALVGFGPDGSPLPRVPFGYPPDGGRSRHLAAAGKGLLVATPFRDTTGVFELLAFEPGGTDTVVVASVVQAPRTFVTYECVGLRQPRIFEPTLVWATWDDRVAVARSTRYAVDVTAPDGSPIRWVRRPIEPVPATEEAALADLGEGMEIQVAGRPCEISAREMVDGRGFADVVPVISNVVLGPTGELWVERRRVGGRGSSATRTGSPPAGPIDVFNPDGAYVGTLPEGTPSPLLLLPDDRVAYAERDALDIERLVVARILRSPSPDQARR